MAQRLSTRQVIASKMKAGQGGRVIVKNDGRDCADCAAKANQYMPGGQKPPFHPNCRCSLSIG